MISVAASSIHRLARGDVGAPPVMESSCPVPYFGRLTAAAVATVGINPSNREFVDGLGRELDGPARRFPTLRSLGLTHWREATSLDVTAVMAACDDYFSTNPYSRWFATLDAIIDGTGSSYYSAHDPAVHLDLVPYATQAKWAELQPRQQRALLDCGTDQLGSVIRNSSVELLVLNGSSVVREFEKASGIELHKEPQPAWDLQRSGPRPVRGHSFVGEVDRVGSVDLGRHVSVVGFNHNVQSSFGVTRRALRAIARWIGSR